MSGRERKAWAVGMVYGPGDHRVCRSSPGNLRGSGRNPVARGPKAGAFGYFFKVGGGPWEIEESAFGSVGPSFEALEGKMRWADGGRRVIFDE